MASEVLIKIPAVNFSQVKGGLQEMSAGQELALLALPAATSATAGAANGEAALQRAAQLEHNLRFLREQHHLMLSALHQEVEALRQRNRELQFQLVMSSAAGSAPVGILQDLSSSSPEDDSRPRVILSPRQPNLSPLQVEILEKDLAELRIDLKEERDKNMQLHGVVQEQQRRIEQLKAGTSSTSARLRDAQCQAGAGNCAELSRRLDEAQRTIRNLRRENEDTRRELNGVRGQLSRSLQQSRDPEERGSGDAESEYSRSSSPRSASSQQQQQQQQQQQHRFPPLNNGSYWQQQHRPGMEFSGSTRGSHSHSHPHQQQQQHGGRGGRGGGHMQSGKEAGMGGRPSPARSGGAGGGVTLPALHGNAMFLQQFGPQQRRRRSGGHHFYNNNNNGSRQHNNNNYYHQQQRTTAETTTPIDFEGGIQGRKYRGTGSQQQGHRGAGHRTELQRQ